MPPSDDLSFYNKLDLPSPKLPPQERLRRRMCYRNFFNLTPRICPVSGKRILSMYHEEQPFPVFAQDIWWGDSWDARDYGATIDFTRPFFDQYRELAQRVPRFALAILNSENCDYSNAVLTSKNCYLIFGSVESEDCLYGHIVWRCKSCVDCLYAYESQWCSHSVDIVNCYAVHYSQEVPNCQESYFLYDCRNCQECFCCYNLRNKQYCWCNEQLTREEYRARLQSISPLTRSVIEHFAQQLATFRNNHAIRPASISVQCEESTGNHLYYTSNAYECFDLKRSEHARYCYTAQECYNSYDISFSGGSNHWCVDSLTLARCEEVFFSHYLADCSEAYYSEFSFSSKNIFGCMGLKRQSYCILNKQYSPEVYTALKAKLIEHMKQTGEWGEFFPGEHSVFAYNESIAHEYLPLTREEALSRGYAWKELLERLAPVGALPASQIPMFSPDDKKGLAAETFICPVSKKGFRFTTQELEFYERMELPLPETSFRVRNTARMQLRDERALTTAQCAHCAVNLVTSAPKETHSRVLCAACYAEQVG
jgi:hypothetical protein